MRKTHYYPFGSSFAVTSRANAQPYKYNGKELDQMHGLNLYDYSARYYESAIGRFTSVDPMAEDYYSWSPYVYVGNNPMRFIDPEGKQIGWPINPAYYRQVAASQKIDRAIKDNSSGIRRNAAVEVAGMTDLNDAVVLGTAITRGRGATNVDGTPAGGVGIGFAAAGAILPIISGSAVKGVFKSIGKALGIGGDAAKGANKVGDATNALSKVTDTSQEAIAVTKDGVALPKGYKIPDNLVENPHRGSSYGEMKNGKFVEKLRIDPATTPGKKGPNTSHYHLDGKGKHYTDPDKLLK